MRLDEELSAEVVANRARQRELYGSTLGERVRRLTTTLGVTQARLARTLGISPAMLSQLVSARRVKIGDPVVLARLLLLDRRCSARTTFPPATVEALLTEAAQARWEWTGGSEARVVTTPAPVDHAPARRNVGAAPVGAAEALRRIAPPARLAAAAAALGPAFPELAEVLRQAAARPG